MLCRGMNKGAVNRSEEVICLFMALARMVILVHGAEFSVTSFNAVTCS